MNNRVWILRPAQLDLEEFSGTQITALSRFPSRGHRVPELERIGVTGYREIHSGEIRIVYLVENEAVYVLALLDRRRDLREILFRRTLR